MLSEIITKAVFLFSSVFAFFLYLPILLTVDKVTGPLTLLFCIQLTFDKAVVCLISIGYKGKVKVEK